MPVDVTERYIRIRMQNPSLFQEDSFRTIWISQKEGIKAIIGKKKGQTKTEIQAYLFDKEKEWTVEKAKKWVKEHKKSKAELLVANKTIVTASAILCSHLPNLSIGKSDEVPFTKEDEQRLLAQSKLNDTYYFYCAPIHEGKNKNGDYFFRDELIQNYKSAGYKPIDWEHNRYEIIGTSLDSQLVGIGDDPLAVGFNGIINRLSPYMTGPNGENRDELIRQRYFENRLALSMECLFDHYRCTECGYETRDIFEFEHHVMISHPLKLDAVGRGLVGVEFIGHGVVEFPADVEPEIISLRTSDDGVLEEMVFEADAKFGDFGGSLAFARASVLAEPDFDFEKASIEPTIEFIKKDEIVAIFDQLFINHKTKIDKNNDKDKELNNSDSLSSTRKGDSVMFKLKEKLSQAKTVYELFTLAYQTLFEFAKSKNSEVSAEEMASFTDEFSTTVKELMPTVFSGIASEVSFDMTKVAHDEAISALTATYEEKMKGLVSSYEDKMSKLTQSVADAEAKVAAMEREKQEKADLAVVDSFINDIKAAGVSLTPTMEDTLRGVAMAKVKDSEALKALANEFVLTIKKTNIINDTPPTIPGGGSDNSEDLKTKLAKAREDFKPTK